MNQSHVASRPTLQNQRVVSYCMNTDDHPFMKLCTGYFKIKT